MHHCKSWRPRINNSYVVVLVSKLDQVIHQHLVLIQEVHPVHTNVEHVVFDIELKCLWEGAVREVHEGAPNT